MQLAKLEKLSLREVWKHEALDFTNWLAQEDNLELLSEEIGIEISLIETEARVGNFNVDISAIEESSNRRIIIENQLESSNHDHLGKIITYASGIDAEIIVWIVKQLRDEHKQAVDWLNERTDSKVNIFVIEMEVWRIGDSPCAPKFNVVVQPNDWRKAVREVSAGREVSDTRLLQLEFWNAFNDYAQEHNVSLKLRKARPQQWYDINIGSSKAHVVLTVNTQAKQKTCELYINNSKALFHDLFAQKEGIEAELGEQLEWFELPGKKASRIKLIAPAELVNKEVWDSYHAWMVDNALKFQGVFVKLINQET